MNKNTTSRTDDCTFARTLSGTDDAALAGTVPFAKLEFAELESFVRSHAQSLIQRVLEEEVEELLGRVKSQRRTGEDAAGYRNGYGRARGISTSIGTVTVRRPRVRGTEDSFISRALPMFKRHTEEVGATLPELYLHGLSLGDFDLAMRGLLGDSAPLSSSSIARLKAVWQAEYTTWGQRSLSGSEVVYLWVDGIYVKAGLEKDKAALLVGIAALSDGRKEVIAVECGQRESEASWGAFLRSLKSRGMPCPRLVIGDGNLGIWSALNQVYPEAAHQRCWVHRMRNVLDCVGKKKTGEATELLRNVMYAETKKKAVEAKRVFQKWARDHQYVKAAERLEDDWDRMVSYYGFPQEHWVHLRTSNVIESPFSTVRLRTAASKRFKKVENATAMIWKLLLVAEKTFRKLNSPELLAGLLGGEKYADGKKCADDPNLTGAVDQPALASTQEGKREQTEYKEAV